MQTYSFLWIAATMFSIILLLQGRSRFQLFSKNYWIFLTSPWKIGSYIIATAGISILSRYANDPTWDIPVSIIMSTLTFFTAPWAVGVVYRAIYLQERIWQEIYIAVCMWLFSASWCYDLYVWLLSGAYPFSWSGNLMVSTVIYLFAGIFWNLEERNGKTIFAFREGIWLSGNTIALGRAIFAAICVASAFVSILILFFILNI